LINNHATDNISISPNILKNTFYLFSLYLFYFYIEAILEMNNQWSGYFNHYFFKLFIFNICK